MTLSKYLNAILDVGKNIRGELSTNRAIHDDYDMLDALSSMPRQFDKEGQLIGDLGPDTPEGLERKARWNKTQEALGKEIDRRLAPEHFDTPGQDCE